MRILKIEFLANVLWYFWLKRSGFYCRNLQFSSLILLLLVFKIFDLSFVFQILFTTTTIEKTRPYHFHQSPLDQISPTIRIIFQKTFTNIVKQTDPIAKWAQRFTTKRAVFVSLVFSFDMQNVSSRNLLVSRRNKSGSPAPWRNKWAAEQFSFYRRNWLTKKRFATRCGVLEWNAPRRWEVGARRSVDGGVIIDCRLSYSWISDERAELFGCWR